VLSYWCVAIVKLRVAYCIQIAMGNNGKRVAALFRYNIKTGQKFQLNITISTQLHLVLNFLEKYLRYKIWKINDKIKYKQHSAYMLIHNRSGIETDLHGQLICMSFSAAKCILRVWQQSSGKEKIVSHGKKSIAFVRWL